ncbi:unnamed protein product, partial [Rotaria sordida]
MSKRKIDPNIKVK